MPWKDEEFTRPRSELLAATRRRGEQLRQRRRRAYLLAAPALLLVVAIPAALALNGEGGRPTTVATSGGGTVTTMSTFTTTTIAATTTTEAVTPTTVSPSTTVVRRATSTTSPAVSPTSAPVTTAAPTTTTTPDIGPCDRSKFTLSRPTTDKATYRPGEEIVARATFAYNASSSCSAAIGGWSLKVRDASGTDVYGVAAVVDYVSPPIHEPGDTETISERWSQVMFTTNGQAPPGTYTLILEAGGIVSPPASVQLVAG